MNEEIFLMILQVVYKLIVALIVISVLMLLGALLLRYIPKVEHMGFLERENKRLRAQNTELSERCSIDALDRNELVSECEWRISDVQREAEQQVKEACDKADEADQRRDTARKHITIYARLLDAYIKKYGVLRGHEDEYRALKALSEGREAA